MLIKIPPWRDVDVNVCFFHYSSGVLVCAFLLSRAQERKRNLKFKFSAGDIFKLGIGKIVLLVVI